MFKKLRNKFLILNMVITTLVMLTAFFTVYIMMYTNSMSENLRKLEERSSPRVISFVNENTQPDGKEITQTGTYEEKGFSSHMISSNYVTSFSVELDDYGNVQFADSYIDMTEESFNTAVQTAWNERGRVLKLEGKIWLYQVSENVSIIYEANTGAQTTSVNGYKITYLDITDMQNTLNYLLITFLVVAAAVLFVIFGISLYFANRSIKPISQAWEKQRQFIADASHELKTPLSVITSNYDALMVNQDETIKSQTEWLSYMKIGMDRMANLIHDLLSLAKFESTDKENGISKSYFNISTSIEQDARLMEAALRDKLLTVTYNIQPEITAYTNEYDIRRVFNILLENAFKYTGEEGRITISLKKVRRHIICSIENTGKGIAANDIDKVFDRFYRADSARSGENSGYGLGLSIAKAIILRLGGKIYAQSIVNEKTVFTFTIDA